MFKHLTVALMTVLLSTGAFAQSKKKTRKKSATKTEAPAATPEATPMPTPEAAAPTPAPEHHDMSTSSHHVSQAYWQPAESQSAFEIGLSYGMVTGRETASGAKFNDSILRLPLSYDYGFTGDHSLGISTSYRSDATKTDPATVDVKASGMTDVMINSKNYSDMGGGQLLYGISLGISTAKGKRAGAGTDGVESSGGMSLPLYVGWQGDTGSGFWGAVLGYDFRMEQTYDVGGSDVKLKNNNVLGLNLFYEGDMEASYWMIHLGYTSTGDGTNDPGSSTVKFPSTMPFGFEYGWLHDNMRLALAYEGVSYMEVDQGGGAKDKAYLEHNIGVKARWAF